MIIVAYRWSIEIEEKHRIFLLILLYKCIREIYEYLYSIFRSPYFIYNTIHYKILCYTFNYILSIFLIYKTVFITLYKRKYIGIVCSNFIDNNFVILPSIWIMILKKNVMTKIFETLMYFIYTSMNLSSLYGTNLCINYKSLLLQVLCTEKICLKYIEYIVSH